MVSGSFWVVSAGFSWFQSVSDGFRWFQVVPRFSKYGLRLVMRSILAIPYSNADEGRVFAIATENKTRF